MAKKEIPPLDPEKTFLSAEQFLEAARILARHMPGPERKYSPAVPFPYIVHAAFSLELFLKCLLTLEGGLNGGLRRSHKAKDLFDGLQPKTKKALEERDSRGRRGTQQRQYENALKAEGAESPKVQFLEMLAKTTLADDLAEANDAFEYFRYSFEDSEDGKTRGFTLGFFVEDLRVFILELMPEWDRTGQPTFQAQ